MRISLVIATYQRAHLFDISLQRLIKIGTIPEEIIVVDDGSTDDTREVVERFKDKLPIRYIYRHFPTWDACSIPRNIGLKEAKEDWLMTMEPEIIFITDIINQFKAKALENPEHIVSQGVIYQMNRETPKPEQDLIDRPEWVVKNIWEVRPFPHHSVESWPPHVVAWDNPVSQYVCLYKREWLTSIGGWDEDFSPTNGGFGYGWDDIDLLTRLRIKGHNQVRDTGEMIHQYHERPGANLNGVVLNEEIIRRKKLSVNSYEDPNHPLLVANQGREWGRLKCSNRHHPFCVQHLHCRICEPKEGCP